MRSSPLWPSRLATVPTMPRELRAEDDWVYLPGQFDAIAAPTDTVVGGIREPSNPGRCNSPCRQLGRQHPPPRSGYSKDRATSPFRAIPLSSPQLSETSS